MTTLRTRSSAGFTLMELLVAMTLLGLLLFLINMLFQDTAQAVTTSAQTSKVLAAARVINEQIGEDADKMTGPANVNGGYIVIIQQRLQAKMLDPRSLTESTNPVTLRSDQLVFIRNSGGLNSMTPQNDNSYRSSLVGQPGDYAKVWYGIARRTRPDGTNLGTTVNHKLGGSASRLDRIGSNFILARQAMLFDPTDVALSPQAKVSANPGSYTHASNEFKDSPVQNTSYSAPDAAYMGLTDVCVRDYAAVSSDMITIGTANTPHYLNTAYLSATDHRLRVNPAPNAATTAYSSWAIAQTHPILSQACSEFVVDFAADLDGDGQIDTEFGGQSATNGAPIWWYDGLTQPNLTDGLAGAPTRGWTQQATVLQPWFNIDADTKAFVFRVDDTQLFAGSVGTAGTPHSYWPYLIRIRYRLHDLRGRLTSNDPSALTDGLDNDGDGAVNEQDEEKISGRWFERIIPVPRP